MKAKQPNNTWDKIIEVGNFNTLFIDRDGGIIERLKGNIPVVEIKDVKIKSDFLAAAAELAEKFRRIIVISTLCPTADAPAPKKREQDAINAYISEKVSEAGGRIDGFYTEWVCDDEGTIPSPGPLLPLLARRDFPSITFPDSAMVGDIHSDRLLAFNCGMEFFDIDDANPEISMHDQFEIVEEQNIVRHGVNQYIETLNRLNNSTSRINGIRLAARCGIYAFNSGRKVLLVCSEDTVMDAHQLKRDFDYATKGWGRMSEKIKMINETEVPDLKAYVNEKMEYGDVIIILAVNASNPVMVHTMHEAQKMGVVTICMTGAKPGALDMGDVIVKVPSTVVSHIQGSFRLILSIITSLWVHEYKSNRAF